MNITIIVDYSIITIIIILDIRTSKVDCVEDSTCNKAEISDTCSQVMIMMVMIIMH